MTLATGPRLGPYEILSTLGAGGMSGAWKTRHIRLDWVVVNGAQKDKRAAEFQQGNGHPRSQAGNWVAVEDSPAQRDGHTFEGSQICGRGE